MDSRGTRTIGGGGYGLGGPVPRDLWILLGTVFFTFSLQFFSATAGLVAALRLSPQLWRAGWIWQPLTYPFAGSGAPSFWFVVELLILFMFGRDIYRQLGRVRFWRTLVEGSVVAAVVAVVVRLVVGGIAGNAAVASAFSLMQGQHMLLVILIAAFATLNRHATIHLFFVLPIQAGWFLGLEILFAFLGFLGNKDLAGFLGICAAVGVTYASLHWGGSGRWWRELSLRARALWYRLRLAQMKKKRGLRLVKDDDPPERQDPWVH